MMAIAWCPRRYEKKNKHLFLTFVRKSSHLFFCSCFSVSVSSIWCFQSWCSSILLSVDFIRGCIQSVPKEPFVFVFLFFFFGLCFKAYEKRISMFLNGFSKAAFYHQSANDTIYPKKKSKQQNRGANTHRPKCEELTSPVCVIFTIKGKQHIKRKDSEQWKKNAVRLMNPSRNLLYFLLSYGIFLMLYSFAHIFFLFFSLSRSSLVRVDREIGRKGEREK